MDSTRKCLKDILYQTIQSTYRSRAETGGVYSTVYALSAGDGLMYCMNVME
jgi:hypothetical protein